MQGEKSIQTSNFSSNHQHITGNFAEHLVLYLLSKNGYECAHVQHVGIDIIASKDGKRLGISVKSRSRKNGKYNTGITVGKPNKHVEHVCSTCKSFACDEYFAFVLDQRGLMKVILTPLTVIKKHYQISSKSSQDWNTKKFENEVETQIYELTWKV